MVTSTCPNCQQSVTPSDDICENCGFVLVGAAPVAVRSTTATQPASPPSPRLAVTTSGMVTCPNCKQPIKQNDDICEQCGMMLAVTTVPTQLTNVSTPSADECPQCHRPRSSGAKFCNSCGFRYAPSPSTTNPPSGTLGQAAPLKIGTRLNNKYKLVKIIGAGGMGAVYLAEDQVLKRQVVIKALLSDNDPDLVAQSVKEREFLAAIKHANIVSIYDFITVGSQGYIVMEYVHGKTLDQIMEEQGKAFEVADAIRYIMGILPAFTYLAKLDLVYCDFKPQNVMLETLKDGSQIVKLIDMGTVIKYVPKPKDVYGTHGFYAPEAVKSPSPETDLYSICRTLAYMVTEMDLANPIFGLSPSEYYKAFRDYPALYRLLAKGTHSSPARRFHRAEDLNDQLAGVLRQIEGGSSGVPVSSRMFVSGILTTSGKLGLRGEAVLDEKDQAIDLLRYGDQALRRGKYSGARSYYMQASRAYPKSVDAHLRLAEVMIDEGEYPAALAEITKAQRIAPSKLQGTTTSSWKIVWYTGRLLEAQEDLAAAADQYRELIADLPGELPPQQALARVHARWGKDDEAVALYTNVLKADPGNTDAILGITQSLLNLQRWDEVIKVLSGISEAAAKYVDAQLLLCDVYLKKITPLTSQNVQRASEVVHALAGRTEDSRYFLARADVYRAAWQQVKRQQLPVTVTIAGVSDSSLNTLGMAARESYEQYLRREQHPTNREEIIRRKFEVTPWKLF